jgi:probable HAF family extracellular repeat protein
VSHAAHSILAPSLLIVILATALVFPPASFAQTEPCKFTLLPIHDNGSATGINRSDTIVGTYIVIQNGQGYLRGFIRESNGRVKTYQVSGSQSTYLNGINDEGVIVGGFNYQAAAQAYGFKLDGNRITRIIYPGAAVTNLGGINNTGEIVGTEQADPTTSGKGFLLNSGHFTDIQFPGAVATGANAINDLRVIVGNYSDQNGATHGFVFIKGHYVSLDFPGSIFTTATGINNAGEIVGRYTMLNGPLQSFVYENGKFETVNIPDTLSQQRQRGECAGRLRWRHLYLWPGPALIHSD